MIPVFGSTESQLTALRLVALCYVCNIECNVRRYITSNVLRYYIAAKVVLAQVFGQAVDLLNDDRDVGCGRIVGQVSETLQHAQTRAGSAMHVFGVAHRTLDCIHAFARQIVC